MTKKILSIVLTVILGTAFLYGCTSDDLPPVYGDHEVAIWTAPATQKIVRDFNYERANDIRLEFEMAKNEVEGGQLIITPLNDSKVTAFDVVSADLEGPNGAKIPKDRINVYLQKYIRIINKVSPNPNFTTGYVPDALLPFNKAVEYGENKIDGINQGLYFTVETSSDTPAGQYTGMFRIVIEDTDYNVPVKVTVWDFAISDEVHAKSLFAIWQDNLMYGELESTDRMYNLYVDALLDYRLSVTTLKANTEDEFLEKAVEAHQNPRVSAFAMPYSYAYSSEYGTEVNYTAAKQTLKKLIRLSTEDMLLLDKLTYYFGDLIDEPQFDSSGRRNTLAQRILNKMNEAEEETFNELVAEGFFDNKSTEFRQAVLAGLRKIPNILTADYNEMYNDGIGTFTPMVDQFDSQENRDLFAREKELNQNLWWYTCVSPAYPYPTYHLDDYLLGARVMSWMQYDYKIDGNLYWVVNLYSSLAINKSGQGDITRPVDAYEVAQRSNDRWTANGDGHLFYPGAVYGIDGPVGSLRLEAIRDGLEEYEYLYALNKLTGGLSDYYAEEIKTDDLVGNLYKRLYTGTKYVPDDRNFYEVRREVARIIERSNAPEKFIVTGLEFDRDNASLEFMAADGYAVSINGQNATGTPSGSGKRYSASLKTDKAANYFTVKLEKDGQSKVYEIFVGGKTSLVSDFETTQATAILKGNDPVVSVSLNTDSAYARSGNSAKIVANSKFDPSNPLATLTFKPQIEIAASLLKANILRIDELKFSAYNDSDIDIPVTVVLYSQANQYELSTVILKKGQWTQVVLPGLYRTNWRHLADTDKIVFRLQNTVNNSNQQAMPRQTLYIDDMLVSEKA